MCSGNTVTILHCMKSCDSVTIIYDNFTQPVISLTLPVCDSDVMSQLINTNWMQMCDDKLQGRLTLEPLPALFIKIASKLGKMRRISKCEGMYVTSKEAVSPSHIFLFCIGEGKHVPHIT